MSQPLVTVICLCYNHENFIKECINSVVNQTYKNLQIIIVDDASTDGSKEVIKKLIEQFPDIEFLNLENNLGNCAAFNQGLNLAKGDYIVDLATDDVFLPSRIEKQVELFSTLNNDFGVVYSDAIFIDNESRQYNKHSKYLRKHGLIDDFPTGDIYQKVISKYFISPPSLLVKREVFEELEGYDEQLAYEDFDFWIRSARNWKYAYLPEPLTLVRKVRDSLSSGWYKKGDKQLFSTYLVCQKISQLNRTKEEDEALINRLKYELRQSVFSENNKEGALFYKMLKDYSRNSSIDNLLMLLSRLRVPLAPVRRLYNRLRFS
ncbi:glycosyltransferase [Fulvivirga sp. RKSG066]|uniref:glycosyltransferase family 2 protein n=1 Tax=Fulvivirga aurantia TaxID=2529383 RepID=UPI0012BC79EF|nr:glycosyltransferase [Fulvivirga aurantia]MTI22273.1 glycosyltransferase [Fulvivirga aurantia]